jgi:hypothetical protein
VGVKEGIGKLLPLCTERDYINTREVLETTKTGTSESALDDFEV